jgi:Sec-independent protein translocase protein TatA
MDPEKLFVVLAAVFVFLGPKELPVAARTIGSWINQLRSLRENLYNEYAATLDPSNEAARTAVTTTDSGPAGGIEEPGFGGPASFR